MSVTARVWGLGSWHDRATFVRGVSHVNLYKKLLKYTSYRGEYFT